MSKKEKDILEKCRDKKLRNIKLVDFAKNRVTDKTLSRIEECSSFLQFIANKDLSKKKLATSNFCKNRFCPFCAWRKSLKEALQVRTCMKYLKSKEVQEFYFLTLTAPNVSGDSLENEIKNFNIGFKRLMQLKEVKELVRGYARKLEVTYNSEPKITKKMFKNESLRNYFKRKGLTIGDPNPNYNTYHPHFHVILCVDKNTFKKQAMLDWLKLWQDATRKTNITQVKCDKINMKVKANKEALEIAKYASKDSDYLHSQDVFDTFYKALKGKRILVYSGNFKKAVELYKQGKLDILKDKDTEEYIYLLMYQWSEDNNYKELVNRELTEEEYKKYNGHLIDEVSDDEE